MGQPTLTEVVTWTRQAGKLLRDGYGKRHEIDHKGRIDLVTEMDRLTEDYLLGEIRGRYPDHAIVTEESGHLSGTDGLCWYLDPLDGTTNYAHAVPLFSVSVAFAVDGRMQLGAIYDPMRDECFSAERGAGAWLNGEPIHVSETSEMVHSLLVTGFPYDSWQSGRSNIENFAHFTRLSQGVRRLGSAALDLCYVACGRFEGYWEQTLKPWDLAAGSLIVTEAGGLVSALDGDLNLLKEPYSLLAGNSHIHGQMLREFNNMV